MKKIASFIVIGVIASGAFFAPINSYAKSSIPSNVSAICKDGTYSTSAHRSGTCSHHKGVKTWIKNLK